MLILPCDRALYTATHEPALRACENGNIQLSYVGR
jgi:hypothetical protein